MGFEGGFEGSALGGVGKGGLGVGVGCGELGALRQLGCRGFFGGGVTDLAGEHFAVLAEEIHVRVSADFAGHGLDKAHRFDLRHSFRFLGASTTSSLGAKVRQV